MATRMRTTRRRWSPILLITFVALAACEEADPTRVDQPVDPGPPRPTAPIQDLDVVRLYRLVDRLAAGAHGEVHSLLVQRNGELVIEEYFRGFSATTLHSLQSITKSFASALIGIAIENGHIADVDEPVLDFFPHWADEFSGNPLKASMRIEDILTMRTGTDYHENGADAPHWELNALATGLDYFWLSRPMLRPPGTFWQYDSGGVITLSSVLRNRTGLHADRYADEWLFGPLGITQRWWFTNQEGLERVGNGDIEGWKSDWLQSLRELGLVASDNEVLAFDLRCVSRGIATTADLDGFVSACRRKLDEAKTNFVAPHLAAAADNNSRLVPEVFRRVTDALLRD